MEVLSRAQWKRDSIAHRRQHMKGLLGCDPLDMYIESRKEWLPLLKEHALAWYRLILEQPKILELRCPFMVQNVVPVEARSVLSKVILLNHYWHSKWIIPCLPTPVLCYSWDSYKASKWMGANGKPCSCTQFINKWYFCYKSHDWQEFIWGATFHMCCVWNAIEFAW